jgi:hypothetical protein
MTPEEKALLESTHTLVKENNEMLQGIARRGKISFTFRAIYWTVIILISLGALYFLQPYVDAIQKFMGE